MVHGLSIRSCVAALTLLATVPIAVAQTYDLVDLGSLGGDSSATAINASGQVTGSSWDASGGTLNAFLYSHGTMQSLGTPLGPSQGSGINDKGQVVGAAFAGPTEGWPITLFADGKIESLGNLGGRFFSEGQAINNRGQITGRSAVSDEGGAHAFLYDAGHLRDLGTFGGANAVGFDITEDGRIVGASDTAQGTTRAFLYDNGSMTNLGSLGGTVSEATGINERGQIVGWSYAPGAVHAFLYDGGAMQDIGTTLGTLNWAWGINDAGDIVGSFLHGADTSGFLYAGGRLFDLNALLDPTTPAGWNVLEARGINDSGQIAATARFGETTHAVLLTPAIPEPETWMLLLLGFGVIGARTSLIRRFRPDAKRRKAGDRTSRSPIDGQGGGSVAESSSVHCDRWRDSGSEVSRARGRLVTAVAGETDSSRSP